VLGLRSTKPGNFFFFCPHWDLGAQCCLHTFFPLPSSEPLQTQPAKESLLSPPAPSRGTKSRLFFSQKRSTKFFKVLAISFLFLEDLFLNDVLYGFLPPHLSTVFAYLSALLAREVSSLPLPQWDERIISSAVVPLLLSSRPSLRLSAQR